MTDTQDSTKKKSRVGNILGIIVVLVILYLLWYFIAYPLLQMFDVLPCTMKLMQYGFC